MNKELNLNQEEIKFLKELGKELREQENDFQASPRFWVVGDYKYFECERGEGDRESVFIPDNGESSTINHFIKILKEDFKDDDELLSVIYEYENGIILNYDFENYIKNNIYEDAFFYSEQLEHIVEPNTMFLTKKACQEHIRLNNYHYTKKAYAYAMTAWRSPKVEKLLKILEKIE